jgi:hypothetical protein
MSLAAEKRLLQLVMAVTLLLPFTAAIMGVVRGPGWLGHVPLVTTDLDSHFRYVSGLFLMMLCLWASCIPNVERKTARIRLLGLMVVTGGVARLASLFLVGTPSTGHLIGLGIELVETPLILLWQARVARCFDSQR